MKKGIPDALLKQQEQRKNETIDKIQSAIDTLKEEGTIVTKKLLIELTGYSASLMYKEHVEELLKKNEVCQYRKTTTVSNQSKQKTADVKLIRQNEQLQKKYNKLTNTLIDKDSRILKLESDLQEKDEYIERLLGKIHNLARQLDQKGLTLVEK